MNKETIYLESSDDITDILSKIKASDKKLVVLVPPKKPTVLLSAINIKLIARTVRTEKKTLVLVTTDDSLTKLAMAANLPVAPSLKSRPILPGKSADAESKSASEPAPEPESAEPVQSKELSAEPEADAEPDADALVEEIEQKQPVSASDSDSEADSDSEPKSEKPSKKSKKPKKSADPDHVNPLVAFLNQKKAWVIFGIVALAGVIVFFIWALMIAPKLHISVKVRTSSGNFSENVNFTKVASDEKVADGIFAVREETLEKAQEVKFTATGQKDLGDPASGTLIVYYQGKDRFSYDFSAGSTFAYKGLEYVATASASLSWSGEEIDSCDNKATYNPSKGCIISASVSVKASAPGENYNVSGEQSGWSSKDFPEVSVYNKSDLSGGTSKIVTIVQQSDIDLALDKLTNDSKEAGKTELLGKLSETVLPLEASFVVETTEPKASPAAGEEVPEGTTPSVSSKTTFKIFTVEKTRIEEFITLKANLEENRKIYSIGEPFVEYFTQTGEGTYSGKLKTTYKFGPRLSETEILERIDGQKVGRIEPLLRDNFPGVSSVSLEKSVFWVNKVPKNPNRVTINLEVEE
ncbi:hypothetical protein IJI72_00165 [Candidatus Saccharibacteria bacterium]|nr:hypothetical protein [Candidatus Saccharibacteria bacterium]